MGFRERLSPDKERSRVITLVEMINATALRAFRLEAPLMIAPQLGPFYVQGDDWAANTLLNPPRDCNWEEWTLHVWTPNHKAVLVTSRVNSRILEGRGSEPNTPVVLLAAEDHEGYRHRNVCACPQTTHRNNLPFTLYCLVCQSREMSGDHASDKFPSLRQPPVTFEDGTTKTVAEGVEQTFLNPTLLYHGEVSASGLSMPRLTMRQPLSVLTREEPRLYRPPYAGHDLEGDLQTMLGLSMMKDAGLTPYLQNFEKEYAEEGDEHPSRFPSLEAQLRNQDLRHRDTSNNPPSVDWILSNTVHMQPFQGPHVCPWCGQTIKSKGVQTLMDHIYTQHSKIFLSMFTCPTCLPPTPLRWERFADHYVERHQSAEALLVVLDESAVSQRLAWGFALHVACLTDNYVNGYKDVSMDEANQGFTELGGFVVCEENNNEKAGRLLIEEINSLRDAHFKNGQTVLAWTRFNDESERVRQEADWRASQAARSLAKEIKRKRAAPQSDSGPSGPELPDRPAVTFGAKRSSRRLLEDMDQTTTAASMEADGGTERGQPATTPPQPTASVLAQAATPTVTPPQVPMTGVPQLGGTGAPAHPPGFGAAATQSTVTFPPPIAMASHQPVLAEELAMAQQAAQAAQYRLMMLAQQQLVAQAALQAQTEQSAPPERPTSQHSGGEPGKQEPAAHASAMRVESEQNPTLGKTLQTLSISQPSAQTPKAQPPAATGQLEKQPDDFPPLQAAQQLNLNPALRTNSVGRGRRQQTAPIQPQEIGTRSSSRSRGQLGSTPAAESTAQVDQASDLPKTGDKDRCISRRSSPRRSGEQSAAAPDPGTSSEDRNYANALKKSLLDQDEFEREMEDLLVGMPPEGSKPDSGSISTPPTPDNPAD